MLGFYASSWRYGGGGVVDASTLFFDNFESYTPYIDLDGQGSWVKNYGIIDVSTLDSSTIVTCRIPDSEDLQGLYYWNNTLDGSNLFCEMYCPDSANAYLGPGLFIQDDASSGYWIHTNASNSAIWKMTNGSYSNVNTESGAAVEPVDGDLIRIEIIDASIRMYINNIQVLIGKDESFRTGYPGMGEVAYGSSSMRYDWWTAGTITQDWVGEYSTVYHSFSSKPPSNVADAQNTLVQTLTDASIWEKLDLFYVLANDASDNALINWIDPGTFDCTKTNEPTSFVAYEGYTGNGSDFLLDTNYDPASGTNMSLNSTAIGLYCRTDSDALTYELGADTGSHQFIVTNYGGNAYGRVNCESNVTAVVSDSLGLYIANRPDSSTQEIFKNYSLLQSDSDAVASLPTDDLKIFEWGGTYSSKQISVVFGGASLSNSDVSTMTEAVETYMDSNGKGVISW